MATEDTGSEGGSNSSTIRSEAGEGSEEVPGKVPPPILSFENDMAEAHQVHENMPLTMRSVLEGSSFQEKCGLLGVAPRESGLCVQTAAGPGGARGPVRVESPSDLSFAHPANVLYNDRKTILRPTRQTYFAETQN